MAYPLPIFWNDAPATEPTTCDSPQTYQWFLDPAPATPDPGLGETEAAAAAARAFGDILLEWSDESMDAVIAADDIAADPGLRTAVLLSLMCERRAEDDDELPGGADDDRRGWWADELGDVEGDRMGSRLWLLSRAKRRDDVLRRAEEYTREALAWMLEDRVASRIDVEVDFGTEAIANRGLLIAVTIHRPGRDPVTYRFAHVWDGEAARAK